MPNNNQNVDMSAEYNIVCPYQNECPLLIGGAGPDLIVKENGRYSCWACSNNEIGNTKSCAFIEQLNLLERIANGLEKREK